MRVTVLASVVTGVNIRTKVSPNDTGIGHISKAVVRSSAVSIITRRAFSSILEFKVGGAWHSIDKDGRLVLDSIVLGIGKLLEYKFIQNRLLDVAAVSLLVKPSGTNITFFTGIVRILDGSKRQKGGIWPMPYVSGMVAQSGPEVFPNFGHSPKASAS